MPANASGGGTPVAPPKLYLLPALAAVGAAVGRFLIQQMAAGRSTASALHRAVVFAVAGAGQASAGPGVCVSGPFGYAFACVDTPGWGWYGPGWDGGWDNGWHGDHDEWEDD